MFLDDITKKIAEAAAQIKTEPPKNEVNAKSVEGAVVSVMTNEELKGNQHKIDANKNGKIDAHDFKLLRSKKKMNKEEVEQLDEIGDTPEGQKRLLATGKRAFLHAGTKKGGKGNLGDAGVKTLDRVEKRLSDRSKNKRLLSTKIKNPQAHPSDRPGLLSRAASAVKKVFTREDIENTFNDFTLDEIHMFMMTEEFQNLPTKLQDQIDSYLEERSLNEGFPTVADARKRAAEKSSSFEKKKISTGTVYSRKYKAEPEETEEMPKKKAKTMKEMLDIYKNHGAESLVENLMIEEPSQDEYKKEVETAQAKSEGKIRNDKGVAKAASQGVRMEEVEIEVLDADEINGVQIDNIDERSMTDAEMKKREEIVKSMKKGIQGFKERYGERAKNVMYATATKQAMKEDAETVDEVYNPVTVKKGVRRNVDSSGKVTYSGGERHYDRGASSMAKRWGHEDRLKKKSEGMWRQKHPILSKLKDVGQKVGKVVDKVAAIKVGNKMRSGG